MSSQREKVGAFHRLHAEGCFVMPNPWDAGTAVALEQIGFKALATTSAGHVWSLARPDNGVRRDGGADVPRVRDHEAALRMQPVKGPDLLPLRAHSANNRFSAARCGAHARRSAAAKSR